MSYTGGGEVFIGRDMAQQREYSDGVAEKIDTEIRAILDRAHDEAYRALNLNRKVLDALAKELMERETPNQDEIARIFKTVKKLPVRPLWLSKKTRPVSKQGPIQIPKRRAAETKPAAKATATATDSGKNDSNRGCFKGNGSNGGGNWQQQQGNIAATHEPQTVDRLPEPQRPGQWLLGIERGALRVRAGHQRVGHVAGLEARGQVGLADGVAVFGVALKAARAGKPATENP